MEEKRDHIKDLADIRSMMERSSKFLSLSGWAGIMAGIYAIAGAYFAFSHLGYNPESISSESLTSSSSLSQVIWLGVLILALAVSTAAILSIRKGKKRGDSVWNATSRRLIISMFVPLLTGGILILIFLSNGLVGLTLPTTLLFYGLALYNDSKFTFEDVKYLGFAQIVLGLASVHFIEYSLILWTVGFGLLHIMYGIYMHFRYER